ncbi:MAG TPA: hypothetical protein PLY38_00040 [Candidatus Hydrothermia bacterium]|nr:hypothetical protein [Candidatus Hydrothermae bacterium]MDD3648996.1 hypothetical protein [Candidatus Hydrothermia bacterium]HRD22225.1 hypothetical protein [Candidatus Hydrothermia bacterium]
MKTIKWKLFLRAVASAAILVFGLTQVFWGIRNGAPLIVITALLITCIFFQYTLLSLLYLLSKPFIGLSGQLYTIRIGNIELSGDIRETEEESIKRGTKYLILKNPSVTLSRYPFFARFLIGTPRLFLFSSFSCHSYPLFFKNQEGLERFYEFNKSFFGEKVAISKELMAASDLTSSSQDHIL